ncbi:hypothetical protein GuthCp012 (chloroplast) [Guillardia theta]|uniref:Uncharacterized 15.1 kDa protein n=2 Tax=Guillardia theta TaxID=55529 RepID=YCX1_GUITH|nr:hypothetical protein GuthCp012 [Guillardia theta]O78420.1 RecName: Full=Uncharacterized 15.1 kDa protein; AltName: Full=ORF125 [Guillardia theta]AAC35605.1 unknown [Guillardia theta]
MRHLFKLLFLYMQLNLLFYIPNKKSFLQLGEEKVYLTFQNSNTNLNIPYDSLLHKLNSDKNVFSKESYDNWSSFRQLIIDKYGRIQGILTESSKNSNLKNSIQLNNYLLQKTIYYEFLCIEFQLY